MNIFHATSKHIHRAGDHFYTHRKKYFVVNTALAVLFMVLSITGITTHPSRVSALAGALSVSGHEIAQDATGIARNTSITFMFNQNPTPSTVMTDTNSDGVYDNMQLSVGGSPVPGTMTYDDVMQAPFRVYIFTPTTPLAAGTYYVVSITGGASGVSANGGADYMTTDYGWGFTTVQPSIDSGTVMNSVPAAVSLTSSAPFAEGISTTPSIRLNFNTHVLLATITANTGGIPDNVYVGYKNTSGTYTSIAGSWNKNNAGSYDYIVFTPTVTPLKQNTEYQITVTTGVTDDATPATPMAANYTAKFLTTGTYGITTPMMSATYPTDRSGSISEVGAHVDVTFDQPIDPATISGKLLLYAANGTSVSGTVTLDDADGSILHFVPGGGNLSASQTYSVKLMGGSTGIKNINNVAYTTPSGDNVYWTFHTTDLYPNDTTPPTVGIGASNVIAGATGISVDVGSITVPFTEVDDASASAQMDVSTINANNIYLASSGPVVVMGTSVTYDYATKTATLTNIPRLMAGTTYLMKVASTVTDAKGNGISNGFMQGDVTWSFTTAYGVLSADSNGNYLCDIGESTWDAVLGLWNVDRFFFRTAATGSSAYGYGYGYSVTTGWKFGFGYGYGYNSFCNNLNDTPSASRAGYFFFEAGASPTMNLAAVLTADGGGNYVDTPDEMELALSGNVPAGGVGSKLLLPANLRMKALNWDGTVAVAYSTSVPTGIDAGKVVSVNFGSVVSGNPVKLSGAALVTIPLAGFSPSTHLAKVVGTDNVTYSVPQCGVQYNNGNKSLVSSYTLGNYASGAVSAQECYTYDSSNVYIAANHFSTFAAGTMPVVITTPVVSSITPADTATGVSTGATIVVTFDQAIATPVYSPTMAAVSTAINGSNPISFSSIAMNEGNTAVTLTPDVALTANTTYYVILQDIAPAGITEAQYKMPVTTFSFTTENPATIDLSAQVTNGVVTLAAPVAVTLTTGVAAEGVGSKVDIPTGLVMSATGWDGVFDVGFSTTVPSGVTSGKVVSITFSGATAGEPVKLSGAALVTIPLAGFNPSLDVAKIIGTDNVTYTVAQCTTQYDGGDKSLVASYTLGNFASGAAAAQQCYTYDASNVYIISNHFTSFVAGRATTTTTGSGGGGIILSFPQEDTTKKPVETPKPVEIKTPEIVTTPTLEVTPIPVLGRVKDFKDLLALSKTSWQYPVIKQMLELGLMKGSTNKSGSKVWNMNSNMLRAEAAVLIARYMGFNDKTMITDAPFKDVSAGEWYASSVAYLKSSGIISGKTPTTFVPGANVSRAEFFKMAVMAYINIHPDIATEWNDIMKGGSNTFADVKKSDWFYPYMNLGESKKLLTGYMVLDKKMAKPYQNIIRVEAAAVLSKFLK